MPFQRRRTPLGQRRHHLHFQRPDTTDDGMGGQTLTWTTVATAWGRVEALDERQREAVDAQQLQGRAAYHIDIARRQGPEPRVPTTWRILWDGKTLEIHHVVDDTGRKRRHIILASEVQ